MCRARVENVLHWVVLSCYENISEILNLNDGPRWAGEGTTTRGG